MKIRITLAVLAICGLAGCSPNEDIPNVDNGGSLPASTPAGGAATDLAFDPCKDIDDGSISAAGLDPRTRKPSVVAEAFKYEGCSYESRDKIVAIIISADTTFQKQSERFRATGQFISVNGRPTIIGQNEISHNDGCDIIFELTSGVMFIDQTIKSDAMFAGMQGCDGAEQIANAIEPSLPKGN